MDSIFPQYYMSRCEKAKGEKKKTEEKHKG